MDYRSEVNFIIDGLTYICPVFSNGDDILLYIVPEVYDVLVDDHDIIYAKKNVYYKEKLYNAAIKIERNLLRYWQTSSPERKDTDIATVIVTNSLDYTKKPFVMNYCDGLFDILSTDWHVLENMTKLLMHVCCNDYGSAHVHDTEMLSKDMHEVHCVLETYDLTDKVISLREEVKRQMNEEIQRPVKDMAYYPDVEVILERFTKQTHQQVHNNVLSELAPYGVWNLSDILINHIDDLGKGLYVVFECEYEKRKAKVFDYKPTGYGYIPDLIEIYNKKIEFEDDCKEEVLSEWSFQIPLNTNDFLLATSPDYKKVTLAFMERTARPIDMIKVEKVVMKEVESTLRETIVVPAFYQTIVNNDILEIIKNRYKIAVNIFNHASYIKDKVLYIQIGKATFNEVGRNQNHVIFEIDGNIIKDKEGIVNIIDEQNNTIYTQKYKLV